MDEPLKRLMQILGSAINDSLSESARIAEAIGEIKEAGYDVFLILEATIGFNRREPEQDDEGEKPKDPQWMPKGDPPGPFTGQIKFNSQDRRFLYTLKIDPDDPKQK